MPIEMDDVKKLLAEQQKQNAEMLKAVIQELKKPTILEQQALDREQQELISRNEERKTNAGAMLQKMAQDVQDRAICTHRHRDGNSHCVYIPEKAPSPGYILCQQCQGKVRPGARPETNARNDIYDTNLYNRLFQELPSNELFQ